jgi:hypothetical protein
MINSIAWRTTFVELRMPNCFKQDMGFLLVTEEDNIPDQNMAVRRWWHHHRQHIDRPFAPGYLGCTASMASNCRMNREMEGECTI